jgi:hypothetical protein
MAENDDRRTPGLDDDDSIAGMRRRHIQIAMRMQALGALGLAELEAKAAAGKPLGLSADDARALLNAGMEMERAALGEKEQDGDGAPIPKKKLTN